MTTLYQMSYTNRIDSLVAEVGYHLTRRNNHPEESMMAIGMALGMLRSYGEQDKVDNILSQLRQQHEQKLWQASKMT